MWNEVVSISLGDWTEHFGIYPYRKPTNASNDHFIVMSSQLLQHVSAYQRHHQGAHMILTRYLYVGVACEDHMSSLMMVLARRNM
jgi:hypothetical protein